MEKVTAQKSMQLSPISTLFEAVGIGNSLEGHGGLLMNLVHTKVEMPELEDHRQI